MKKSVKNGLNDPLNKDLMRVVFRVEGESNIGLGHVMRCMALAQGLVTCGHEVFFLMSQGSQQFCRNRTDWQGKILAIPETIDNMRKNAEPEWLAKQCADLRADWLVLDGYQFDHMYRHALQSNIFKHAFKLAIFDDINNSGELCADMVINGAHNAGLHNYQETAPIASLATGHKYQVLRQEFLQLTDKNWSSRQCLTLMFGGSDPHDLTFLALHYLALVNAAMPITVITGAAYAKLNDLAALIESSRLDITHLHDCQNMAAILVNTKLALSAAGGSQFELHACATPSILVVVAENQKYASQDAANQGWCRVVNNDDLSVKELIKQCLSLWQQSDELHNMHQKALQLCVIDGARNIVELMSGQKNEK